MNYYVQQANIIKLLVLNIYVNNKKRLTFEVNPGLEELFSKNSDSLRRVGDIPDKLTNFLSNDNDFEILKTMVQFYISEMEPNFDIQKNFSKTQQILYGLEQIK